MYTKSFNTKKTWLGAMFSFALVAIMGLTFAFKPFSKTPVKESKRVTYFFTYTGQPGSEYDRNLWQLAYEDEPGCGATNDGCLIEVNAAYTSGSGTSRILNTDVPVASGTHKNPTIGPMVVSASNKNP